MATTIAGSRPTKAVGKAGPRFWTIALLYGGLYFVVMGLGAALVEPFSGGCMFVIPAYFMVLVVALPVLMLRRFGTGMTVFLPYAVVGFFPEYFADNTLADRFWGAAAWSALGLLVGLTADIAQKYLPGGMPDRWRAVALGTVTGLAMYLTTYLALEFLYSTHPPESHYQFFTSGIYFTLPWFLANGAFAGYTALQISGRRA